MYSYGPPHMAELKQDDQQEHTYSSCVRIREEDLPEAMNDGEKWRERVRDIRTSGTTWWWWWHTLTLISHVVKTITTQNRRLIYYLWNNRDYIPDFSRSTSLSLSLSLALSLASILRRQLEMDFSERGSLHPCRSRVVWHMISCLDVSLYTITSILRRILNLYPKFLQQQDRTFSLKCTL